MAAPERTVLVRPRTVLIVLGIGLLVAGVLGLIWATRGVVGWILIAVFLAMALNPAVEFFARRGLSRARSAVIVSLLALVVIGGLSYLLIPPIVDQVREFIEAVPDLIDDLVAGQGPLGFLQRDYKIVDRVRQAIEDQGIGGVLGLTGAGLSVARSVLTAVVGVVAIAFLTFFLLLDGQRLLRGALGLVPDQSRPRWERTCQGVYKVVGGYVTGNLLLSVIAGAVATAVLYATGTDYAISLGVVVAIFDLVPLAGATIAAVIVVMVALATEGVPIAAILVVFVVIYPQVVNYCT